MHKLHRDSQAASGLNYRHGVHTWGNGIPTRQEKAEIWVKLIAMQGERCAYCEGPMPESSRHIEHFQQRSRSPQNTFLWNNLFGSCNRRDTCGHHKDQCGNYPPTVLIKPDEEDPEHFLVFDAQGGVSPRHGLSVQEQHRATETIRILNLNGALQQIRLWEVQGYVQTAEYFADLANEFQPHEWQPMFQEELDNTASMPYATAIRHVLTDQSMTP